MPTKDQFSAPIDTHSRTTLWAFLLGSNDGPFWLSSVPVAAYSKHVRTKTYRPKTQRKIERYHRLLKNLILLAHCYALEELTERIRE